MHRALEKKEKIRSFLADRAFRIFPTYWIALLLAIALAALATPFNQQPLIATADHSGALPANLWAWVSELALLPAWSGKSAYLLVTWTLTSELAFYALVAAGLGLVRVGAAGKIPAIFGFLLATGQAALLVDIPTQVLDCWPEFMCGVLAWQAPRSGITAGKDGLYACCGITILGILGWVNGSPSGTLPASACFALLLVLLKRFDRKMAAMSAFQPLAISGAFSYSLYLIHIPLISPAQNLLHRLLPDAANHAWIPLFLVLFALPPAWLFFKWVEQPFESWRHKRARHIVDVRAEPAPLS